MCTYIYIYTFLHPNEIENNEREKKGRQACYYN